MVRPLQALQGDRSLIGKDGGGGDQALQHEGRRADTREIRHMSLSNEDRYVRVPCDCGCAVLEFIRFDWDGEYQFETDVLDSRYDHNVNGLLGRLRRAFGVLVSKPVYFNGVTMTKEEFSELVDRLIELREC